MEPLKKIREFLYTPDHEGSHDPETLKALLRRQPEGIHLVYAEELPQTEPEEYTFAAHVAALANACGGFVLVGAAWNSERREPELGGLGVGDPEAIPERLEEIVATHVEPKVDVLVTTLRIAGGWHLAVVEVPRSLGAPHHIDGAYPLRVGRGETEMAPEECERLERARAGERRTLSERARAVALGHPERDTLLRGRHGGARGAFLYVASIPAVLSGRGVQLRVPEGQLGFHVAGETLRAWVNSQKAYTFTGGSQLPMRFAVAGREGEALFASRDLAAFRVAADKVTAFGVEELEAFVVEALRRGLPALEAIGFAGPFYAALVVKPDRVSELAAQGGYGPGIAPSTGSFNEDEPLFVDGVVPLAFHRRPSADSVMLPLVENLRSLAGRAS